MKLFESTVFQFSFLILSAMAAIIIFAEKSGVTWVLWVTTATTCLMTYAGKEGVKYGSAAYRERGNE